MLKLEEQVWEVELRRLRRDLETLLCASLFHVLGQTEELVKALQDLENAASGDATVRQKIASLPQEVQDVSLLEKITGQAEGFLH